MPRSATDKGLRADARRNHAQVLSAAREVFVEHGARAPLEEVARRAGVGIGTLYRRFPDRDALLRAVVVQALHDAHAAAETALAALSPDGKDDPHGDASVEEADERGAPDALDALAAYMHAVLELRVSAVVPLALDGLDLEHDNELAAAREGSASAAEKLIQAAHDDGSLPRHVNFADIGTLLVRLSRPLPGPVPRALDDELARRHLRLVLAGLRSDPDVLAEKGLSRQELRSARDPGPGA